ncbi:NACHT domain-containing protein [Nonomuraea zeae]|uniref:NACHT domain-containing protein n=1 Tax=Nonomuraea zeae TaxID=1642303 RepID=A0A5S4FRB1_9ACTN|nr:NACHT domain-containing protein [Nonomuraea zeae]TMR22751.1 NACHT domain-containing protein [Nonomuraea zeae]
MPGVEAALTAAGKSIAERAMREWLATRAARKEREADLKDLIQSGFRDRLAARKFGNQLQGVALAVEGRLARLVEQEFRGLDEAARAAVLLEVVDALRRADLSDAALFEADADPAKLAERVLASLPAPRLGEAEDRLYAVLLAECVDCLTGLMRQLPQYLPRAATESLARLSGLAEGVERLLARLPLRTLEAPDGRQDDAAFERHYLGFLSRALDEVELFGVRVENYRPRTSLSVAYISLNVSAGEHRPRMPERLSVASLTGRQAVEPGTERIESALGRSNLMLLRGDAGSGKSTLLRWLAVTAARGDFSGALSGWNGCVPMMVKLRSHSTGRFPAPAGFLDDVAQEVAGRMPRGWVERVLESGRGLLLVDGVDELLVRHRPAVREWLSRLLTAYPSMRVVVTSRPTAADARWLADEGFAAAMLEPMTPEDLRELVRQWHVAMRDCPSLPCAADELEGYEVALLARMESNPHLGVVASTPLLAAMLCALNLDRRTQLPRNRMGFYDAVLSLLLERRDAERRITDEVSLDPDQKIWILRDLAWRLVSMGRSELSKATALKSVGQKLALMTRMPYSASDVLEHLLRRSGVVREPVPGRIDFAHRTVQEYLAAGQLVEDEDVDVAVERAHLDQWREVVVMAAGHAAGRLRKELLTGLLDRADQGGPQARRLRLVVAGCLETIQEIPLGLRDRIEQCLATVIPPRTEVETNLLAAVGEEVLHRLPRDLSGLREKQAALTVRTTWLINGAEALDRLAGYASDERWEVHRQLQEGWHYYDAEVYAKRVLAESEELTVPSNRLLRGLAHLGKVKRLFVTTDEPVTSLRFLRAMPGLESLDVQELATASLDGVEATPELRRLWVSMDLPGPLGVESLERLPQLDDLTLWNARFDDLTFLDRLPRLEVLGLDLPAHDEGDWLGPLSRQTELRRLFLDREDLPIPPEIFESMRSLKWLTLWTDAGVIGCLRALERTTTHLEGLSLLGSSALDLAELGRFELTNLSLSNPEIEDLTPLRGQRRLDRLSLPRCAKVTDLTPLAGLPSLRTLDLSGVADGIDLGPLAGMRHLTVVLNPGQRVTNEQVVRETIRISRR